MGDAPVLTVTLNLAYDVTYHLARFEPEAANAVDRVDRQAGGKGVNVARVLERLGVPTVTTGFAGGRFGDAVREDLEASGLAHSLERIAGETRQTITIAAGGGATLLSEPGPTVRPGEWRRFLERYDALLGGTDAVVISGRLPPGLPGDAYAVLVRRAGARGVPAAVDTSGEPLRAACAARPALVKVNREECRAVVGASDAAAGARALVALGARSAVVSAGRHGMVAAEAGKGWSASAPPVVARNATGAGDTAMAALVTGLREGTPWPQRLARACALAATTVAAPLAGQIDPEQAWALEAAVEVVRLPA